MRLRLIIAAALLVVTADGASAATRRRPHGLGSRRYSTGINANQPSRDILNPGSSNYGFGKNLRREEKRRYPGAVVYH